MWFNNVLTYNYELNDATDLSEKMAEETLKPCPPHARFTYGWLPVIADELAQEVAGAALICLGKEERILPRGVINRLLAEKVQALEVQQGRILKRSEKAQMAEDLEFELLPRSFCVQKRLTAVFDTVSKRLQINTSSDNQASQLTSLLRKSLPGLQLEPLFHPENLSVRLAGWITDPTSLPPAFELASDCLLFSLSDEKKKISCKGYELPADEIITLLSQGLATAELSLIWKERIQFTLTQDLTFKRLKTLEYLVDDYNDIRQLDEEYLQRDAELTLMSGELRSLTDDLMSGLSEQLSKEEKSEELPMLETV